MYKKADNYPLPALMVKSLHRTLITEYHPKCVAIPSRCKLHPYLIRERGPVLYGMPQQESTVFFGTSYPGMTMVALALAGPGPAC